MKQNLVVVGFFMSIIIFIGALSSCEKDDYCLKNPVTPNLILRFYDDSNRETLKSVEELNDVHLAQTLTYLKLGNYKLGLLINFNVSLLKNGIRRVINGQISSD